jgi:hypothetical protein
VHRIERLRCLKGLLALGSRHSGCRALRGRPRA